MVKHSPLAHGRIFHARTLRTAASAGRISAAGIHGAVFLAVARAHAARGSGFFAALSSAGRIAAMAGRVDRGNAFDESSGDWNLSSSGSGRERGLCSQSLATLVSAG